ncbi:MAG: AAA family ATPase, partial [Bacteroidota bacterium]
NSDPIFKEYNLSDNSLDELVQIYNELSSGHKIVLLTVTKLVELVDDKTLVLLDEPETHLHPPLLSSFMKSISDLMIKRNAVAIIATHSPVVLQEVPKSCVTIVNRFNTKYTVYRPSIETYGETISRLTREIFQLEVLDSGFYKTISDYLKQNPSYDNLVDEFDEQLGSEAKILARSILLESGENGDV